MMSFKEISAFKPAEVGDSIGNELLSISEDFPIDSSAVVGAISTIGEYKVE
ncbi:hypothetical protein PPUN109347_40630 [Pseudomonas putida]|nr:hypothetical protein PPUN109347_40630 [Pseudomonas putida]